MGPLIYGELVIDFHFAQDSHLCVLTPLRFDKFKPPADFLFSTTSHLNGETAIYRDIFRQHRVDIVLCGRGKDPLLAAACLAES